jgi:hypothetical protein
MHKFLDGNTADDAQSAETERTERVSAPALERPVSEAVAAEYLGLTKETLSKYRLQGAGPPHRKIGSTPLYLLSALEQWLKTANTGGGKNAQGQQDERDLQEAPPRRRVLGVQVSVGREKLLGDDRFRGNPKKPGRRERRT